MSRGKTTDVNEIHLAKLLSLNTTWYADWSKWDNTYFAVANVKKSDGRWTHIRLHRFITECSEDEYVLHLDKDGLNNLDDNLVIATRNRNGSTLKRQLDCGVGFDEKRLMWYATVPDGSGKKQIGYFLSKQAAQIEYDRLCSRN